MDVRRREFIKGAAAAAALAADKAYRKKVKYKIKCRFFKTRFMVKALNCLTKCRDECITYRVEVKPCSLVQFLYASGTH